MRPPDEWDVRGATQDDFTTPSVWTKRWVTDQNDDRTGHLPSVTLQGNTVNVLWADDEESAWKVRGSRTSGAAISTDNAFLPDAVASSASNVYAVYSRVNDATGDYDIHWNRSTTGGQAWVGQVLLAQTANVPSLFPSVTWEAQGASVWAAWREGSSPGWQIQGQLVFTE